MASAEIKDRVYNTHVMGQCYPCMLGDIVDEALKAKGAYKLRHSGRELEDVDRLWSGGSSPAMIAEYIINGREIGLY